MRNIMNVFELGKNRKHIGKKKIKIRTRFMAAFAILLLFSFSLIGVIFNIAAGRYIESNAIAQLESADGFMQTIASMPQNTSGSINPIPGRINTFRIQANMFPLNGQGDPPENYILSDETAEITKTLKESNIYLKDVRNRQIKTDNGIYYISVYYLPETPLGDNVYWIVYADVTGLSYFANTINFFLITLVFVMFAITVFVTIFLSNSITTPIKKLSLLAFNIGKGDFSVNDYNFKDIEFDNLNTALNKTAKQLDLYDSQQKAFFQNVSHELRTPLMSIRCYAEGIAYNLMPHEDASKTILQETDKLTDMVTDLLYISKIDNITSAHKPSKVDLIVIIRTCAQQQKAIADEKHIRYTFNFAESQIFYECLDELISRAISNLISNAIRYASSEIVFTCYEKDGQIIIRVADDGPGIEADSMPHVFERFYKGSGGNQGIGLSIVKSIAEQHNGRAHAENFEQGGAVFTITLPHTKRR